MVANSQKLDKSGLSSLKDGSGMLDGGGDNNRVRDIAFQQKDEVVGATFFDDLRISTPGSEAENVQFTNIIKYAKRKAAESADAPNKVLNDKINDARKRLKSDLLLSKDGNRKMHPEGTDSINGHNNSLKIANGVNNAACDLKDRVFVKDQIRKRAGKKAVTAPVVVIDAAPDVHSSDTSSFAGMGLARSLLKAVSHLGFVLPTPVQSATIPVALTGRDVCVCAATGTGKTAAYLLPILERIVHAPENAEPMLTDTGLSKNQNDASVTRVLILVPTRELAVQVYMVAQKLTAHAGKDLTVALVAGGMDIKQQVEVLRARPTIVIATPGRLIDHVYANATLNVEQRATAFSLDHVEVLVLDEADRMLDESFEEQIHEIINLCPPPAARQTMMFSATMSNDVLELAAALLNAPQKIFCNEEAIMSAPNLRQEFVRVRNEMMRDALLLALVLRDFPMQTLVFVATKADAHRIHIILGLLGVNVGELHGNLSQAQRLDTLQRFRERRQLDVLVATDVAARGIDIPRVQTVINYRMPSTLKAYIHRVGRTARAGHPGRAVSLVGESERKLLRHIVQASNEPLTSRLIPPDIITQYHKKLAALEPAVNEVLQGEKQPQPDDSAGQSEKPSFPKFGAAVVVDSSDSECDSDAKKTVKLQKPEVRRKNSAAYNRTAVKPLFKKKSTRKMKRRAEVQNSAEHRQRYDQAQALQAKQIRSAKKSLRAQPLRAFSEKSTGKDSKNAGKRKGFGNASSFGTDLSVSRKER